MSDALEFPAEARSLIECRQPLLIGVRHHSAVMARAVVALLQEFQPEQLLLELPPEFQGWLATLADDQLRAPVALAATVTDTAGLSFYPFADFSPELAAIRWAFAHGVPVIPCDLPLTMRAQAARPSSREPSEWQGLLAQLIRRTGADEVGGLWERMIESPAAGGPRDAAGQAGDAAWAESVRRAALLFGWALRCNDGFASATDLRRETYMRQVLAEVGGRCAAVVGAYHAAALLPEPLLFETQLIDGADGADGAGGAGGAGGDKLAATGGERSADEMTAVIPYSFPRLDERSGYPAGVRDPQWHQRVWEAASPADVDQAAADMAVEVCRLLRAADQPAGAADCQEILRVARDLARLRGYPAPGRGELIEAIQTCLTQGQLLGRGAAVADALQTAMVGDVSGRLPDSVPPCGFATDFERRLAELRLPGSQTPMREPKRMRLDPLRSRLDRARIVMFHRLLRCHVDYAKPVEGESHALRENLTEVWDVHWKHTTSATVQFAAAHGATIQQAAAGALRRDCGASGQYVSHLADSPSRPRGTEQQLACAEQAAACGLVEEVQTAFSALRGDFLQHARLGELTSAMQLLERTRRGHIPGLPVAAEDAWPGWLEVFAMPDDSSTTPFLEAAIGRLEGLGGSENPEDVVQVADLVQAFLQQSGEDAVAGARLLWNLQEMARDGSPLMQGAGVGSQLLLGVLDDATFGSHLGGWVDGAVSREGHRALRQRLQGAVLSSISAWAGEPGCFHGLEVRIASLTDNDFLQRLPALRGGFEAVSPGARERLLQELLSRLPDDQQAAGQPTWDDPEEVAARTAADDQGRAAVLELLPELLLKSAVSSAGDKRQEQLTPLRHPDQRITLADRWRLMLGAPQDAFADGFCGRCASALDELYGNGAGERRRAGPGQKRRLSRGGRERGFPDVRRWAEELEELFGGAVREEVLGQAAESGRAAALEVLEPDDVTPSVDLLQQVLELRGSLPAGRDEQLRKLARRVTEQLAEQLAQRLRPALTGLSTPRPTRRRTRKLDLNRTIRANLRTAARSELGELRLHPDRLIYRSRARRSMDWHVVFVVDVSGSMEPSVIYSALVAAILNGLPALSIQFLAFNTEVMEFTEHVDDPLTMLLEVQIGGGTHIAKGLRAARERLVVPSRSMVLLVTDFEEGGSVGQLLGELEALGATGAKMLGLAALDDEGAARYHQGIAAQCVSRGMPVAALSPLELARWVGEQLK